MRTLPAIAVSAVLLALAACGGAEQGATPAASPGYREGAVPLREVAIEDAPAAPAVVTASDAFGLRILAGADEQANLVFSPASAFVALAMLAEGATNEGAAELDALLGSSGDARSEAVNALVAVLSQYDGDPSTVDDEDLPNRPLLHVANNLVLDDRAQVSSTFLDRLAEFHGAGVQVADLSGDEGKAVLDAWVREHTGGRVEESAIVPDELLYLVLQDAILFAGRWQQEFDPNNTADGPFTAASGAVQTADRMSARLDVRYAAVDGWTAIEVPYREAFAARFVLPPVGVDPASIGSATMQRVAAALDASRVAPVQVVIPRFELDAKVDLAAALRSQGLTAIFAGETRPLLGINPEVALEVQQAVQQATITVAEQGTVAAAVTEIGVGVMSAPLAPDLEFIADRKFLMVVQEQATGWDLFQAVVRSVA